MVTTPLLNLEQMCWMKWSERILRSQLLETNRLSKMTYRKENEWRWEGCLCGAERTDVDEGGKDACVVATTPKLLARGLATLRYPHMRIKISECEHNFITLK